MTAKCAHPHGDYVTGIWVCGKCWRKLDERPSELVMVERKGFGLDHHSDGETQPRMRQERRSVPVLVTPEGDTLGSFIRSMALRLVARSALTMTDALDYAIELARSVCEPFGRTGENWGSDGAWELVDEDMQHWDASTEGSNA